jgi:cytochrome c biogenesis protein CcmG/thiol:disulfide interchange protein DsbE
MDPTAHPEQHPDDLGPPGADANLAPMGRRGLPRGLSWALGLAIVVMAVMAWVALDSSGDPAPDQLNASVTEPGGGSTSGSGQPVPDLTLTGLDGSTVDLASYRGRPMVVNFWASWCPPCLKEMPDFEQVYQQRDGTVAFVGINVRESAATATDLATRTGVTYDLVLDTTGDASRGFSVVNMPTTVFINADGIVTSVHAGALTAAELNERIDAIAGPGPA